LEYKEEGKTIDDLIKHLKTQLKIVKQKQFEKNENEFLELIFEPRLISPEDKYFLRISYRTKEIDNVKKIHENLEKKVLNILNLIEGD